MNSENSLQNCKMIAVDKSLVWIESVTSALRVSLVLNGEDDQGKMVRMERSQCNWRYSFKETKNSIVNGYILFWFKGKYKCILVNLRIAYGKYYSSSFRIMVKSLKQTKSSGFFMFFLTWNKRQKSENYGTMDFQGRTNANTYTIKTSYGFNATKTYLASFLWPELS